MEGYDTNNDTNALPQHSRVAWSVDLIGGPDRDRTDDLFYAITITDWKITNIRSATGPFGIAGNAQKRLLDP